MYSLLVPPIKIKFFPDEKIYLPQLKNIETSCLLALLQNKIKMRRFLGFLEELKTWRSTSAQDNEKPIILDVDVKHIIRFSTRSDLLKKKSLCVSDGLEICNIILERFKRQNRPMPLVLREEIARQVVELWPEEDPNFYCDDGLANGIYGDYLNRIWINKNSKKPGMIYVNASQQAKPCAPITKPIPQPQPPASKPSNLMIKNTAPNPVSKPSSTGPVTKPNHPVRKLPWPNTPLSPSTTQISQPTTQMGPPSSNPLRKLLTNKLYGINMNSARPQPMRRASIAEERPQPKVPVEPKLTRIVSSDGSSFYAQKVLGAQENIFRRVGGTGVTKQFVRIRESVDSSEPPAKLAKTSVSCTPTNNGGQVSQGNPTKPHEVASTIAAQPPLVELGKPSTSTVETERFQGDPVDDISASITLAPLNSEFPTNTDIVEYVQNSLLNNLDTNTMIVSNQ